MNRVDKSEFLEEIATLNGTFRNVTSVLTPTFLIDVRDSNIIVKDDDELVVDDSNRLLYTEEITTDILRCNYVYCDDLKRFYYVTDIQVVNPTLYYLICRVDVLHTYKENIRKETAYVSRNEKKYNSMIPDNNEQLFSDYSVSYTPITNRDNSDVNFEFNIEKITGSNIIFNYIVKGEDSWSPKTITPPSDLAMLCYIPSFALDLKNVSHPIVLAQDTSMAIVQSILEDDTAKSFIKNILLTPFSIESQYDKNNPRDVNPYNLGNEMKVYDFYSRTSDYLILADFITPKATSYLDLEPYKKYSIYVPFYGYVDLDLNKVGGKRVILYYIFDWCTGDGQAYISEVSSVYNNVIWTQPVNALIKVDLSTTNAYENDITRKNNAISTTLGVMTSGINLATGITTGISGIGKAVAGAVTNEMSLMDKGQVGYSSQYLNCFSNLKPYIRVMSRKTANNINLDDYAKTFGLPLFKQYNLSDLTGYTLVNDVILKNDYSTTTEKNEVYSLLKNGIIL